MKKLKSLPYRPKPPSTAKSPQPNDQSTSQSTNQSSADTSKPRFNIPTIIVEYVDEPKSKTHEGSWLCEAHPFEESVLNEPDAEICKSCSLVRPTDL